MGLRDEEVENKKYGAVKYTLKDLLAERGMTVSQLAEQTGMNPVILKRAIAGETQPSFGQMARICSVLHIGVCQLIIYEPPV